jgi:competence protein ComEC
MQLDETTDKDSYESITSRAWATAACIIFLVCAVSLLWIGFQAMQARKADPRLFVSVLDVGQGDAIYIRTPSGNDILVDGGPDDSVLRSLAQEMPAFDREIDLIVATHSDADHIGGLIPIFDRYEVKQFAYSGAAKDSGVRSELDSRIESERISDDAQVRIVSAGDLLILDGTYGVVAEIIFPDDVSTSTPDENDLSVVMRVRYGESEFLLTGDISEVVERKIMSTHGNALASDVLKIGHHGSESSSDIEFLKAVSPQFVAISAGNDNKYGHPHEDVLERIRSLGTTTQIHITKNEGTISFVSDGKTVEVVR